MSDHSNNRELASLLIAGFQLEADQLVPDANSHNIKARLTQIINYLLDHDMERLLSILYRIDVEEKRVKNILGLQDVSRIASSLAELVIERMNEKIETRRRYRE
jgi:hypothetical protein